MKTSVLVLDPTLDPDEEDVAATAVQPRLPSHLERSSFRLEVDDDGVACLTFDMQGSAVNVFNETTLHELNDCLAVLEDMMALKGLIITSAKDKVFIAGADLKSLRAMPKDRVVNLIVLGQAVMNRLASLPMPKVAVIHGACVGGGYELALACDARLASDDDSTRVGLPETQLGLLPAWGGSTRLPRLIGLSKALEVILPGKVVKASAAKRLGLVDEVMPREALLPAAKRLVQRFKAKPKRHHWQHCWPLPRLIAWQAKRSLLARTRGLYPAPLLALSVASRGVSCGHDEAMALERESMTKLLETPETGRLIDLFFAKEAASKKPWPTGHALPVQDVAVIGAGVMGAGIAQWLASRGMRVTLCDVNVEALARGMERVRGLVDEAVKHRALSKREARETLDRIMPAHEAVPLHRQQLIIEAATEDMGLKKKIFANLALRCGPECILATNTSALSVAELAATVPHPERVIGLHFFNPVHRMALVEVIVTAADSQGTVATLPDVIATAQGFVQAIGKTPVVVRDSPGFVVNRVLMPYLMEAVKLFEAGQQPEVIDEAMLAFGMPMGPMRLLDEIGLDVAVHVARTLSGAFPERMHGSELMTALVAKGWLGKKSGLGFYQYSGREAKPHAAVLAMRPAAALPMTREAIQQRLAKQLSDEAQLCFHEGIAFSARDIDLAMVLGTGYAPFRGGPLAYAS